MSAVLELPVVVPEREVLRYMGYPRSRQPSARVRSSFEGLWPEAEGLIRARGAFVLAGKSEAASVGMPNPGDRVAFGVCTIGAELESRAQSLSDSGEGLEALVLDSFGSAAAEEAAEQLHARICVAVQHEERKAGRRVSPGYGSWDVRCQAALLAWLPVAELGIELTEGSMMIPRKSISFAVSIVPPDQAHSRRRCEACGWAACAYRRDAED